MSFDSFDVDKIAAFIVAIGVLVGAILGLRKPLVGTYAAVRDAAVRAEEVDHLREQSAHQDRVIDQLTKICRTLQEEVDRLTDELDRVKRKGSE